MTRRESNREAKKTIQFKLLYSGTLKRAQENQSPIRIIGVEEVSPDDQMDKIGIPIDFNSDWLHIKFVDMDRYAFDGFVIAKRFCIKKLSSRFSKDELLRKVLKAKKKRTNEGLPLTKIPLKSIREIVNAITKRYTLVVFSLRRKGDVCFIGRPFRFHKNNDLTIRLITPLAKWRGLMRIKASDIRDISYGGGYEESLALASKTNSKKRRENRHIRYLAFRDTRRRGPPLFLPGIASNRRSPE